MWTDLYRTRERPTSRRAMLRAAGCGFGYLGLASLLADAASTADNPLAVRQPHFPPKAKRVIFLFMHGGPRPSIPSIRSRVLRPMTVSRCQSSDRWHSPEGPRAHL